MIAMKSGLLALLASSAAITLMAADGPPNIEGSWQPRAGGAAYSVLPHAGGFFLGSESKTGIVEGGELPYQPWAAKKKAEPVEKKATEVR